VPLSPTCSANSAGGIEPARYADAHLENAKRGQERVLYPEDSGADGAVGDVPVTS